MGAPRSSCQASTCTLATRTPTADCARDQDERCMEPVVDDWQIRREVACGELVDGLHDQPDQQHHGEDPPRTRPAASLAQPHEPACVPHRSASDT